MSAISLRGVGKTYAQYVRPSDRLLEVITGRSRHREFVALQPLDLTLNRGEVLGLVGMNGAGKSTLLKLIAGTILPSSGQVEIHGRISALLELGTGFHPEMTGRENVYLSGAVQGMTTEQIDGLYDGIVEFSGLADFMAQPIKTYSSGMFVRLAFAVATCVQPDILIVDEALSVGDGAFALKSFKRIMDFKDAGSTILFCSHSLYQVEAICSRAVWVHRGGIVLDGASSAVTAAYGQYLESGLLPGETPPLAAQAPAVVAMDSQPAETIAIHAPQGQARIAAIEVRGGGRVDKELELESGKDDLTVRVQFASDPALPDPSLAVTLVRADSSIVASASTHNDGYSVGRAVDGRGEVELTFDKLPLLKGDYWVTVFLGCERAMHVYDHAEMVARVRVIQQGLAQGVVELPHTWQTVADRSAKD